MLTAEVEPRKRLNTEFSISKAQVQSIRIPFPTSTLRVEYSILDICRIRFSKDSILNSQRSRLMTFDIELFLLPIGKRRPGRLASGLPGKGFLRPDRIGIHGCSVSCLVDANVLFGPIPPCPQPPAHSLSSRVDLTSQSRPKCVARRNLLQIAGCGARQDGVGGKVDMPLTRPLSDACASPC